MILIRMFRNGQSNDQNDGPRYEPEKALAKLVGRLSGCTHLESIGTARDGTSIIVIDSSETEERLAFRGNEDEMALLNDVCLLYIQARPHLCSESVKALVK